MKFINLVLFFFILSLSSCGTNKNNWSFDVNLINVSPFPYFNEFNPKFK